MLSMNISTLYLHLMSPFIPSVKCFLYPSSQMTLVSSQTQSHKLQKPWSWGLCPRSGSLGFVFFFFFFLLLNKLDFIAHLFRITTLGLPWWSGGEDFTFRCRRSWFHPWSGTWDCPMSHSQKSRTENRSNIVTNPIKTLKIIHPY